MTDKNENIITEALRVAAEVYDKDAVTAPSLAATFAQQASDCRELADKIEQSGLDQVTYL